MQLRLHFTRRIRYTYSNRTSLVAKLKSSSNPKILYLLLHYMVKSGNNAQVRVSFGVRTVAKVKVVAKI